MKPGVKIKLNKFFLKHPHRRLSKKEMLIFAGEDPAGIFYLTKGEVKQYTLSDRGDEIVLNIFKPFAFFPMNWAINNTPNKYFYEAVNDVELYQAPVSELLKFFKQDSEVMFDLLSRLYSGVEGLLDRLSYLMGASAKSRIVMELLIDCRRFGQQQSDGSCILTIHQQELANRTGLTRETVSRELKNIKGVNTAKQGLKITSLADLEKQLTI